MVHFQHPLNSRRHQMSLIFKLIIAGAAALVGIGSYLIGPFKGKQDNIVEKVAEEVIKIETGEDIDLSPGQKENK